MYFFLYDTDSPVQAFLCASDEHLVQSWSGYPVIGNCVKCSGLKTLFTLLTPKIEPRIIILSFSVSVTMSVKTLNDKQHIFNSIRL